MQSPRASIAVTTLLAALIAAGCTESTPPAPTSRPAAAERDAEPAARPPVGIEPAPEPIAPSENGGGDGDDGAYLIADLTSVPIPDEPAHGRVNGVPFRVERATLGNGILEIREGSDFFPDRAFTIFLFTEEDEALDGRWFSADPAPAFGSSTPHIHMSYQVEGEQFPKTEMFMRGHAMRLDFGTSKDGKLPGSIYLCVPDDAKSYVVGSFEAELDSAP